MATREHEYELKMNSGMKETIHVWWDGQRVACDTPHFMIRLKEADIGGKTIKDGIEFLEVLPQRYNNGYISMTKVK